MIISIGDELALGMTVDTNTAWLAGELSRIGIRTVQHMTVEDDREAICDAILRGTDIGDVVIVSGGLGPTQDDVTRFALSDAMGVESEIDEKALGWIEEIFKKFRRPMAESNKVQAVCPVGAKMMQNHVGTAPGIVAKINGTPVYVVPGVPREMRALYKGEIQGELEKLAEKKARDVILVHKVNSFGRGESNVGEMLGELMVRGGNPRIGTTVSGGYVSVRIQAESNDVDSAMRMQEEAVKAVRERLGMLVFSEGEVGLNEAVVELLKEKGKTCATGESCTGGMIGEMLTQISGSSAVYLGGWVTYTNEMKIKTLGVNEATLAAHGAVSGEVAEEMVRGVIEHSGSDYGISVTGIAGPDGGTEEKPVGTVWIGIGERTGEDIAVKATCFHFHGNRDQVRRRSALTGLNLLRLRVLGNESD